MKRSSPVLPLISMYLIGALGIAFAATPRNESADLIVYGGTPSGIITAYSAAREGLHVLLVEPRGFADCSDEGEAAGVAAAIAERLSVPSGEILIPMLQRQLREGHAVLEEPVDDVAVVTTDLK